MLSYQFSSQECSNLQQETQTEQQDPDSLIVSYGFKYITKPPQNAFNNEFYDKTTRKHRDQIRRYKRIKTLLLKRNNITKEEVRKAQKIKKRTVQQREGESQTEDFVALRVLKALGIHNKRFPAHSHSSKKQETICKRLKHVRNRRWLRDVQYLFLVFGLSAEKPNLELLNLISARSLNKVLKSTKTNSRVKLIEIVEEMKELDNKKRKDLEMKCEDYYMQYGENFCSNCIDLKAIRKALSSSKSDMEYLNQVAIQRRSVAYASKLSRRGRLPNRTDQEKPKRVKHIELQPIEDELNSESYQTIREFLNEEEFQEDEDMLTDSDSESILSSEYEEKTEEKTTIESPKEEDSASTELPDTLEKADNNYDDSTYFPSLVKYDISKPLFCEV